MRRVKQAWGVVDMGGDLNLYTVALSRIMAIAHYVHLVSGGGAPQPSFYAFNKLDDLQRERWKECRKKHLVRAIKVTVTWPVNR